MKLVPALLLLAVAAVSSSGMNVACADSPPTPMPVSTSTPVPTPEAVATPHFVQAEFPDWVGDSPQMARLIATSDVVAEARLISIKSRTKKHATVGCAAELIYGFEVVQYLKGDGTENLKVRISGGPTSDVLRKETPTEVLEYAEAWLRRSRAAVDDTRNAILILGRSLRTGDHHFVRFEDNFLLYPAIGETWLYADNDSMYRHQLTDEEPATISLADLKARIEDVRRLTEGAYGHCVIGALGWRDRVKRQLLGTYREMTIAGFREPEPFSRHEVELESSGSSYSRVFEIRRPLHELPLFSDYWLDGKDKDLFKIDTFIDSEYTHASMVVAEDTPQGVYSVHFAQYHQSLPCDQKSSRVETVWRKVDAAEWIVSIKGA